MSLSCSLRSSSNRRLVNSALHIDTRFEIYGSTIGVRNLVGFERFCQQFSAAIQQNSPPPTSLSSFSLVLSVLCSRCIDARTGIRNVSTLFGPNFVSLNFVLSQATTSTFCNFAHLPSSLSSGTLLKD